MKIPQKPSRFLDPEDWHPDHILRTIQDIRTFMRLSRPILTPRVILSQITHGNKASLDIILPYCGYSFKTGPWSNTLIRFGLDPRRESKYRIYQTVEFKWTYDTLILPGCQEIPRPMFEEKKLSHIFDGKSFAPDGKVWQYCDIQDEQLSQIITTSPVRERFSKTSGFFHLATVAKIHVIMEDKIMSLRDGEMPKNEIYECLVGFDDKYEYKPRDHHLHGLERTDRYFRRSQYLQRQIIELCGGKILRQERFVPYHSGSCWESRDSRKG